MPATPDLIGFIGDARKRRSEKFRNQLSIFLVCLGISVFIWTLVRLSKDYYFPVEYHLNYTQVPSHLRLTGASDSTITLKIRIQGFEYFSEHLFATRYRDYEASLRNVRLHYSQDDVTGYLLTSRIGREIVSQTNFTGDVWFVSPDTLFFTFSRAAGKTKAGRTVTDEGSTGERQAPKTLQDTAGTHQPAGVRKNGKH